mgnify:CR=1 FL=1
MRHKCHRKVYKPGLQYFMPMIVVISGVLSSIADEDISTTYRSLENVTLLPNSEIITDEQLVDICFVYGFLW